MKSAQENTSLFVSACFVVGFFYWINLREVMRMDRNDFFFCYDPSMKNYLSEKGHRYITQAKSVKTDQRFWLFPKSIDLQTSIDGFKKEKEYPKGH